MTIMQSVDKAVDLFHLAAGLRHLAIFCQLERLPSEISDSGFDVQSRFDSGGPIDNQRTQPTVERPGIGFCNQDFFDSFALLDQSLPLKVFLGGFRTQGFLDSFVLLNEPLGFFCPSRGIHLRFSSKLASPPERSPA